MERHAEHADGELLITGIAVLLPPYSSYRELLEACRSRSIAELEDELRLGESRHAKPESSSDCRMIGIDPAYVDRLKLGKIGRAAAASIVAAKQSLEMADIPTESASSAGIVMSSGNSVMDMVVDCLQSMTYRHGGRVRANKFAHSSFCAPSGEVAAELGLTGPSMTVSAGNGAIPECVLVARQWLLSREMPYMLAGEADCYFPGMESVYGPKGVLRQEGAGVLVLETGDRAQSRFKRGIARISAVDHTDVYNDEQFRKQTFVISNSPAAGAGLQADIRLGPQIGAASVAAVALGCALLTAASDPDAPGAERTILSEAGKSRVLVHMDQNDGSFSAVLLEKPFI
ncbi:beta-ketoacyl synthase N-terminal-like domain-containing protein [Paenibacillus thailandensis]|uniref:Beta-ketoacyl synthase N-terminal-like domain-containing protein n=1 Tax=Paenibacillus thailandensis TaxID=393250 RepID=A0ABW5R367_9BACL